MNSIFRQQQKLIIYGINKQYLHIRHNLCTDQLWKYKLNNCKIVDKKYRSKCIIGNTIQDDIGSSIAAAAAAVHNTIHSGPLLNETHNHSSSRSPAQSQFNNNLLYNNTDFTNHNHNFNNNQFYGIRNFSMSSVKYEQPSSKIEEYVKNLQEKSKETMANQSDNLNASSTGKSGNVTSATTPSSTTSTTTSTSPPPKQTQTTTASTTSTPSSTSTTPAKVIVKKSLKQKIWDELVHYYHGFRLLFIDINVARQLIWKVLNGKTLTRREYRLLIRTTGDTFRLVPFSVFIIVPFMEFALPLFIKFFPGMLPSTFETAKDKEAKALKNLKVKLEMAKFLQKTLDEMAVQHTDHNSQEAKEFVEFFNGLRTSGERANPEEIMKFSKLFEDEITLDSLSRQQLTALCKVLEVNTLGTSNLLRFQLRMKLRWLAADDRMIQKEGINSLMLSELQAACRSRGMRSYGLSEQQLRDQLQEWISLSLDEKVPPTLLLLSRAMMLPEDVPTSEKLKATISVLSEAAVTQTKAAIGEREGKIDNKTKIDIIRDEVRKIKEEFDEEKDTVIDTATEIKDVLTDKAPIINAEIVLKTISSSATTTATTTSTPIQSQLSSKDIDIVCDALEAVSKEKNTLLVEKEEIRDLKEEIADYREDREELKQVVLKSEMKVDIKESAAAKMLFKKVDSMISKLDKVLTELEHKEAKLQKHIDEIDGDQEKREELVRIDEIMVAMRKMQKVADEAKVEQIYNMLGKIDIDKDGQLKVDDVLKVIETIGKENVNLNEKQIDELIELIKKEEAIENEEKIEKALAKSLVERQQKEAQENSSSSGNGNVDDSASTVKTKTNGTTLKVSDSINKNKENLITGEEGEEEAEEDKHILKSPNDKSNKLSTSSSQSSSSGVSAVSTAAATTPIHVKTIEERINQTVIQNATEAAERQKDKILPLSQQSPNNSGGGGGDVPNPVQLPTNNKNKGNTKSTNDKML